MKDDLTKNKLLGDAVSTGKKVVSGYEKAQRVALYMVFAKYVVIGLLVLGVAIGGSMLFKKMTKDVVRAVAVEQVDKATAKAKAKATEFKEKVATKKAELKEKHSSGGFSLGLSELAKKVNKQVTVVVDTVLEERGFHPDAPGSCVVTNDKNSSVCKDYTFVEISGDDYDWMKHTWPNVCLEVYKEAREILKANGKITMNDQRLLKDKCHAVQKSKENDNREQIKKDML